MVENLTFRKATLSDLDSVIDITLNDGGARSLTRAEVIKYLNAGDYYLIASLSDLDVGVAKCGRVSSEEFELYVISVRLSHQRQGIGRALVEKSIETARQESAAKLILHVRTHNEKAIAFYKALGFEIAGEVRDLYGPDMVHYKMFLRI